MKDCAFYPARIGLRLQNVATIFKTNKMLVAKISEYPYGNLP
jgi:hypothetical protein